MKLSVSLPDDDVEFLDRYVVEFGVASRSAAVQQAITLLRNAGLAAAYEDAWSDWNGSADDELWSAATNDGLG